MLNSTFCLVLLPLFLSLRLLLFRVALLPRNPGLVDLTSAADQKPCWIDHLSVQTHGHIPEHHTDHAVLGMGSWAASRSSLSAISIPSPCPPGPTPPPPPHQPQLLRSPQHGCCWTHPWTQGGRTQRGSWGSGSCAQLPRHWLCDHEATLSQFPHL